MVGWLQANCPPGKQLTHTSFAGGKWSVPQELEGALLQKYALKLRAGERLHLNEMRTPLFNMFCDLDWRTPDAVAEGAQLEVATFLAQQVFLVWELDAAVEAVVCRRDASREQDGRWKGGMHVFWPEVKTDAATAQAFRRTAAERCRERFGEALLAAPWSTVVDDSVYHGSGLRMVYSHKRTGEEAYRPAWCVRMRPVLTEGLVEPEVTVAACGDDPSAWIPRCSIRYHGLCPTKVQQCMQRIVGAEAKAPGQERELVPEVEHLRAVLPDCYRGCRFLKLVLVSTGKYVVRTDSRTCLNLEPRGGLPAQHRSNGVYFVVGAETTYQACHCRCDTVEGRVAGPCKDFRSNHFRTPPALAQALFGPRQEAYTYARPATAADIYKSFADPAPPAKRQRRRGR